MKSGVITDMVRFELMVWIGPQDIAEGMNIEIRAAYVYQILEIGMGPYDVININ